MTVTLSNLNVQAAFPEPQQGTVVISTNRVEWDVGEVQPDDEPTLHISGTVESGSLPIVCDGTLTYDGQVLDGRAVANPILQLLPVIFRDGG